MPEPYDAPGIVVVGWVESIPAEYILLDRKESSYAEINLTGQLGDFGRTLHHTVSHPHHNDTSLKMAQAPPSPGVEIMLVRQQRAYNKQGGVNPQRCTTASQRQSQTWIGRGRIDMVGCVCVWSSRDNNIAGRTKPQAARNSTGEYIYLSAAAKMTNIRSMYPVVIVVAVSWGGARTTGKAARAGRERARDLRSHQTATAGAGTLEEDENNVYDVDDVHPHTCAYTFVYIETKRWRAWCVGGTW
jgi:hypothetical protein